MDNIRDSLRFVIFFLVFSSSYYLLEILYDGSSHWTMFICGGISGIFGYLINKATPLLTVLMKSILITLMILALEYITGYIVNIRLGLNVWDYSSLPFNIDGQISLSFTIIWFALSPIVIWLSGELDYVFFAESKPPSLWYYYQRLFIDIGNLFRRKEKAR